ncbi:MAG: 6-phosphogluconolactonase [Candidatus Wildermuthbacteria bacterium]|nr:6-phosphogluconolactonase [Candidatus Wildermuthbacteria bacterium]
MEVKRYSTKQKAREAAAQKLNQLLDAYSRVPTLFLSSGGSSLELLDGLEIGKNVTVSVLDERYSTDPTVNNFAQLFERIRPKAFIDARIGQNETIQQLAERFKRELREWKAKNPNGKIIITQGMGPDGHTAGIMPGVAFDGDRWVAEYDAKEKNEFPLRVTTTFSFLRDQVDYSIAYITGEKKRDAFEQLLADQGTLAATPARIMREMKNVKIFTDIV